MIASWRSAVAAGDVELATRRPCQPGRVATPSSPTRKAVLSHESPVDAAAFSPDGRTVLTGGDYQTARLWDAATGLPIGQPLRDDGTVFAVAYSPDGKTLLTGGRNQTVRLWDMATGQPIGSPFRHADWVMAVGFHPDGKAVLTGSGDKTARLWDMATGRPIGPPLVHQGRVSAVAFSPDGKAILTGSNDGTARGSGAPPRGGRSPNLSCIKDWLKPWPSAPMARRSSPGPGGGINRGDCGTRRPCSRSE